MEKRQKPFSIRMWIENWVEKQECKRMERRRLKEELDRYKNGNLQDFTDYE